MKRSAGIVAYQIQNHQIMVFLAHMGGPYWKGIDRWSILKGEFQKGEPCKDAAIREFEEECGKPLTYTHFFYLHTEKQKSGKLVTFFAAETNMSAEGCFSNTFLKEFPKGSHHIQEFQEMDDYRWFPLEEAKQKILSGQRKALIKLEKYCIEKGLLS